MKSSRVVVTFALFLSSVLCFASSSNAQVARFRAFGKKAEFTPADGSYKGGGTGTHLGRHSVSGVVIPAGKFFPEPGVFFAGSFEGVGSHTHVSANGDELYLKVEPGRVLLRLRAYPKTSFDIEKEVSPFGI